jgi:hypothetical protein
MARRIELYEFFQTLAEDFAEHDTKLKLGEHAFFVLMLMRPDIEIRIQNGSNECKSFYATNKNDPGWIAFVKFVKECW